MRSTILLAVGALLAWIVGAAAQSDAGDAAHGRTVFMAVGCYECHGMVGQGSVQSGPRLAPEPMPLASLTQLLRQPLNVMPAYSDKALSDRDIADIHAYLASIPQPKPVKDIPLLNY
jgi:ubiquinol-cytochrome c reductase cytochrome c subunit